MIEKVHMKIQCILYNKYIYGIVLFIFLIAVFPALYGIRSWPILIKVSFRVALTGIILIMYLLKMIYEKKINIVFAILSGFYIFQLINTIIHHGNLTQCIYGHFFIGLSAFALVDYFIDIEKKQFLISSFIYFLALHIINIISGFFLTEENFTIGWFFGNRNQIFVHAFPYLIIGMNYIISYLDSKRKWTFILFLPIYIVEVYCRSLTATIVLTIYFIYCMLFLDKKIKLFNIYVYIIIFLIVFLIFTIPGTNNPLVISFCNFVGKEPDASGRLHIYEGIMRYIKNSGTHNPLFGLGILKDQHLRQITDWGTPATVSTLLDLYLKHGILGILFIIATFICYLKTIYKCNNVIIRNFIQITMFVLMIWGLTENIWFYLYTFFVALIILPIGKYEYNFNTHDIKFKKL